MDKKVNRVPRLALGAFALFFAGIIYSWSVIRLPFELEPFSLNETQLQTNYTITMSMFALGGILSGVLSKIVTGKIRLICSGVVVFLGLLMTARLSVATSPMLLYVGYGIFMGLGIGVVYNVVVSQTSAWFPDKKGLCNGVMMMAFGLSSFVLGIVANKLFAIESFGWRKTYLLYSILIGGVIVAVGIFIRPPKPGELPASATKGAAAEVDYSSAQMLKRASFWKLFLFFVLLAAVGGIAISYGKQIFLSVGITAETSALVASLLAICNAVGRLLSGAIFDAVGIRKTQFITSAVVITACAVTLGAVALGISWLALVGVCLCAFSYGFTPTLSAAFCSSFYGIKNFSLNYALLFLFLVPSSLFATVAGKIIDSTGSFVPVFVLLLVFSLVGLVDNLTIKKA